MPGTPTTKYALPTMAGADAANTIDTYTQSLAAAIDPLLTPESQGVASARPPSTTGSPSNKPGRTYKTTDTGELYRDTGSGYEAIVFAGELRASVRVAAPDGWLLCDGSSQLRTSYPALFAALGGTSSPYGLPDGTHFNLPDLRGRVAVGQDSAGVRLANAAGRDLGEAGGEEQHLLTSAESGLRDHAHNFGTPQYNASGKFDNTGVQAMTDASHLTSVTSTTTGVNGGAVNASSAHNNMQPFQVVNWLVKT